MSQNPLSHGARLVWRGDRGTPGKPGFRGGSWVIREGRKERRLGLGRDQRAEADRRLAEYIGRKHAAEIVIDASAPERLLIADVLTYYGSEHAPSIAEPARIGYACKALLPYWGDKTVSEINPKICRDYAKFRKVSRGTVRRELGILRAALNFCHRDGKLASVPHVQLPDRPPARDRWLTRSEVARLVRTARRKPKTGHLARFILIGVYTGTRSGAIRRLRWSKSLAGGHIDLERGVLYRKPSRAAETNKKQPPIRIPDRLLRLLRIWRREDERFCNEREMDADLLPVVHFYGKPVDALRTSWRSVCTDAKIDADVVAHSLRHTAITWAAQAGADPWEMCGFFGITMEELQRTYLHHHPDYQSSVVSAFDRRRVAR